MLFVCSVGSSEIFWLIKCGGNMWFIEWNCVISFNV